VTAAVTQPDAGTIAALDFAPGCWWHGLEDAPERCAAPAEVVVRFVLACGHRGLMLACEPHRVALINPALIWNCGRCDLVAPAPSVEWQPL
jgi:hypothetical protein